jgi:hypothetical protein
LQWIKFEEVKERMEHIEMMTVEEKTENFPNGIRLNPNPDVPPLIDVSED